MKKYFLPTVVAGVIMLVLGMVMNSLMNFMIPALQVEYETSGHFRPWEDPLMWLFFAYPFVMALVMAWAWNKVKGEVKGKSVWERGAKFGFGIWLLTSIPGMLITYSSFEVSLAMVISWMISGLLYTLIAGWVLAKFNQ